MSPWHIAALAIVVLVCFGPKRLPEIGRSMGRGIREFKDGITHHHEALDESEVTTTPRVLPAAGSPRERDSI